MLRLLVLALLLANALFFAWSRGWLDPVLGASAQGDREPQRLSNQVRPEVVQLWPAGTGNARPEAPAATAASAPASGAASGPTPTDAAATAAPLAGIASGPVAASAAVSAPAAVASAVKAAAAATVCLEAGPFGPADLQATLALLNSQLPAGGWTPRQVAGGEWMVYMGPYPDKDWMARKKAELARIRGGVRHEEVSGGPLPGPGLSLGRFGSQAAAETALGQLRLRGIRTARVLRSGDGSPMVYLRLAEADAITAAKAAAIKLQPATRSFTACP
jgi:hypothetical protein